MPFLRFTRDKRGYETTSLVHAVRRGGRSRQRILYWFRTPPGVKVGRPALDEEAIRWIEENNPDIEFDWPKILEAQPPSAPPVEEQRRRGRRDKAERRRPPRPVPQAPGVEPEEPEIEEELPPAEIEAEVQAEAEGLPAVEELPGPEEAVAAPEDTVAEALEQLTHPEAEEEVEPPAMPAEETIGPEDLTRLRARYAELLARIAERGGDAERVQSLRAQAEALNPDAWVTEGEVRQGVAQFEPRIRELRAALGLRRRRRSRRGGRRRRGGEGGPGGAEGPAGPEESGRTDGPDGEGTPPSGPPRDTSE